MEREGGGGREEEACNCKRAMSGQCLKQASEP